MSSSASTKKARGRPKNVPLNVVNNPPVPSPRPQPPKVQSPDESFKCPLCDNYQMTFQGFKGHLDTHISGKGIRFPNKDILDKILSEYCVAQCPHCHLLAGNNDKGKSKGMHKKCEEKERKRMEKIMEGIVDEKEKPRVTTATFSQTATFEEPDLAPNTVREVQENWKEIRCDSSLEEIALLCENFKTIKIAKGLTDGVSQCMHYSFDCIIRDPTNETSWKPLALISFVLIDDGLNGRKNKKAKREATKMRIKDFLNGDFNALIEKRNEIVENEGKKRKNSPTIPTDDEKVKRMKNLIKIGETDKAIREVRSSGKTDLKDPKNVEELKTKFPQGEEVPFDPSTFAAPYVFEPKEVMAKIKELRKGAPGMSKVSANLLFDVFCYDRNLIDKYTVVINHISAANTPKELHENMAVRGISLQKKPSGQRPIGIPEIHNRIVSGLYMDRSKKALREAYSPLQQALNPRGAEVVVHAIRAHIERFGDNPDLVLLLIDFMNAFNEMERKKFLLELIKVVPEMASYLYAEYARKKKMIFDGQIILSTKGLIQGENAGPACCCANENEILQEVQSLILEGDLVIALMDDISIITEQKIAIKVLEFIKKDGPEYGFHVNMPKTVAMPISFMHGITPTPKSPDWAPGIKWIQTGGMEIGEDKKGTRELGSFIGEKKFVETEVKGKIKEKIKPIADLVELFNDPHCAWQVIKRIPALTGLDYIFRTTPPEQLDEVCPYYDNIIRSLFEKTVIGKRLTEEEWERAQLPTPVGWGLTPAWVKSIAGYTASLNSNFDEIVKIKSEYAPGLSSSLDKMMTLIKTNLPSAKSTFNLNPKTKQSDIVAALLKNKQLKFSEHEDQRIRILYKQQNDKKAQSLKTNSIRRGLVMDPAEFQVYARRSLGVDLIDAPVSCKACGKMADIKGDHDCMQDGAVIKRHNVVRDLYFKTAKEGMVACDREKTLVFTNDDQGKIKIKSYRADITFDDPIPGLTSTKSAVDFTFRNAFATSYKSTAEKAEGDLALAAEKDKIKLVKNALNVNNYDFVPLGLESMGYCSDNCKELAYYLIGQKANHLGVPFSEAASEFWHTLSFLIHRQVARNILNRFRRVTFKHEEEEEDEKEEKDFYLPKNSVSIST